LLSLVTVKASIETRKDKYHSINTTESTRAPLLSVQYAKVRVVRSRLFKVVWRSVSF
jgi:hypothetical protein